MISDEEIAIRAAESMKVFANGKETFIYGEWREWRKACLEEGRTIPPDEFLSRKNDSRQPIST